MQDIAIREARKDEFVALGRLTADAYAQLRGMPGLAEMPEYYASLRDVAGRAAQPSVAVLVASDEESGLTLGGVTYVGDMRYYGAEVAEHVTDAAGIRMLVVDERARGRGVGRALTEACIERARASGLAEVVLHTTEPMHIARDLYERMGFVRAPELDFGPAGFDVVCLRLQLIGA